MLCVWFGASHESADFVETADDHLGQRRQLHHTSILFGGALQQCADLAAMMRARHEANATARLG